MKKINQILLIKQFVLKNKELKNVVIARFCTKVESNFCRPSLPPLLGPNGTLAHTAVEKTNLFASLFAESSRLDTGGALPPSLHRVCETNMSKIRIR